MEPAESEGSPTPPGGGLGGTLAHIDLTSRRLELQIVLWGPPGSGTSTALRSLHGAAPAHTRGDLASLEHTDGRRVVCDYAPLDLPRWGAQAVRAHVYTMSAGDHAGYDASAIVMIKVENNHWKLVK